MSKGRKKIDPAKKLVKTGFTITPQMAQDLELLSQVTRSSKSAVLVALIEDGLHDVVDSFRETAAVMQQNPGENVPLDPIAREFLKRIAVSYHGCTGVAYLSFPTDAGEA